MVTKTNNRMIDGAAVNVRDFGAVGDGIVDDTEAISHAFAHARLTGAKVEGTGTFRLTGTTNIDIYTDTEFCDALFIADSWDGEFNIQRTKEKITYGPGSAELAAIQSSTDVRKGTKQFNGVAGLHSFQDVYAIIHTSQPFFWYRDEERTRSIYTRFYNNGRVNTERLYDLDASLITSVDVYPLEDSFITVSGINIERRDNGTRTLISLRRNLTTLKDCKFSTTDGVTEPTNQINVYQNYGSTIENISSHTTEATGAYSLYLGESSDITLRNFDSDGDGWGANGSNSCANLLFDNCNLSRIDSHAPFFHKLTIRDCNIGSQGISVTMIGDIDIVRGTLSRGSGAHQGIISTRPDTLGVCDGSIILDSVRITGTAGSEQTNDDNLFRKQGDPAARTPTGSPIYPTFFKKIMLLNCEIESPLSNFMDYTSGVRVKAPEEIIIQNTRYHTDNGTVRMYLGRFLPANVGNASGYTTKMTFSNVDAQQIQLIGTDEKEHILLCSFDGVWSSKSTATILECTFGGDYLINNSVIGRIDTYNANYPTTAISYKMSNSMFTGNTTDTGAELIVMQDRNDGWYTNVGFKYQNASQQYTFDNLVNQVNCQVVAK